MSSTRAEGTVVERGARIAVFGSTGALGGMVAARLAARGARQRLVVRDRARAPRLDHAEIAEASYLDGSAMVRALLRVARSLQRAGVRHRGVGDELPRHRGRRSRDRERCGRTHHRPSANVPSRLPRGANRTSLQRVAPATRITSAEPLSGRRPFRDGPARLACRRDGDTARTRANRSRPVQAPTVHGIGERMPPMTGPAPVRVTIGTAAAGAVAPGPALRSAHRFDQLDQTSTSRAGEGRSAREAPASVRPRNAIRCCIRASSPRRSSHCACASARRPRCRPGHGSHATRPTR